MKIKSNTTNKDLPWRFGLYQRPSSEENGTNSSFGSCQGSYMTWQEICRTCGSCSHPGSSHTYDRFLATSHHYPGKNRKKN